MEVLQYKIIRTETQYWDYCNRLEELVMQESSDPEVAEEIDLLTLLIEKWDEEHNAFDNSDPVEALKYLMADHKLKATDLAAILSVSKGVISEILSYKKGFSKEKYPETGPTFQSKAGII